MNRKRNIEAVKFYCNNIADRTDISDDEKNQGIVNAIEFVYGICIFDMPLSVMAEIMETLDYMIELDNVKSNYR